MSCRRNNNTGKNTFVFTDSGINAECHVVPGLDGLLIECTADLKCVCVCGGGGGGLSACLHGYQQPS